MQFGAMNFPIHPVAADIETFGSLGFDYLELTMDAPQSHYSVIREQKTEIQKALRRCNMGLMCHLPTFVHIADLTPSIRAASLDEMLRSIEVCAELGATKAVLHPGHIKGLGVFVEDMALGLAYESMDRISKAAKSAGVVLCVENMPPNCRAFVEPENFDPLFARFPEFMMTLDVGHAHIEDKTGGRPTAFVRRFRNRIDHVHVSDNKGERDDHFRLGKGTVNIARFVQNLKEISYNGTITLEIFSDKRADLTASLESMKKFMLDMGNGIE